MKRIEVDLLSAENNRRVGRWKGSEVRGMVEKESGLGTLVLEGNERGLSELFEDVGRSIEIHNSGWGASSVSHREGTVVVWSSAGRGVIVCDLLRDLCEVHPGPWRVRWK